MKVSSLSALLGDDVTDEGGKRVINSDVLTQILSVCTAFLPRHCLDLDPATPLEENAYVQYAVVYSFTSVPLVNQRTSP